MNARPDDEAAVVLRGPWKPDAAKGKGAAATPDGEPTAVAVPVPGTGGPEREPIPRLAARAALAATWQTGRGHVVLAARAWDAATHAGAREKIRLARATGDAAAHAEWLERLETLKNGRRDRLARLPGVLAAAAVSLLAISVVATVVLILFGLIVAAVRPAGWGWGDYWSFWSTVTDVLVTVVTFAALAAALGAIPAWLWLTHRAGRDSGDPPGWLATSAEEDIDLVIDERTITLALAALRIPAITAYLKTGAPLQYLTPARVDGRGTHAVVRLPDGVAAERVTRRRPDLASGLRRRPNELWLEMGSEAGILVLWAADKGALKEGAGPYPLLESGAVDVFKGVPFGKSLRGEPLVCQLNGRNTIVGGMPDQGKSSVARVIMVGAALDITAELRIWVPDHNYDFEVFRPRCSRYVMGAEDEYVAQIVADLEELVAEIQVRGRKLTEFGEPEVTRALAGKGVGMHPIVALLEEAHLVFGHPEFGDRARKAAGTIVRLGRKRFIHLITSTQATTGNSVPPEVTMNSANGIAFAVARWQENDALLGQGAYSARHRATDLIPGVDQGNAVVRGLTGERSTVAQAYFLSVRRGNDQVSPIIRRSLEEIARRGRAVPGTDTPRRDADDEERDLLDDLDEALGAEQVRIADVPALLRDLAPDYEPYRTLTGARLVDLLASEGVKVPSTGNRYPLDPLTVRKEIARRSTVDLDEGAE